MNILFFSNNCEASKVLLSLMQQEKLDRFFHLICTDNNASIPPQIKITPTIIIKGFPTPYAGNDAFTWLSRVKQWKINTQMQRVSASQQKYLQSTNNNLVTTDDSKLLGFSKAEMDGLSDMFAYCNEDHALPQSYFARENIGKETIFTPPNESKLKISEAATKTMRVNLEKERKKQDEAFRQNIDNFKKQFQG